MPQFVDTNIWVYAHLTGVADAKSEAARNLLGRLDDPVISTQVLAEYSAVMIRNHLPDIQVRENLEAMMAMSRTELVSLDTVRGAWNLRSRYGYSIWDCQIIASALQGGCDTLLTEDLQHGQVINGSLTVRNPFV
ncbi:MAG: PIN domain-containing protein [Steroidobacteraceae bacterium]